MTGLSLWTLVAAVGACPEWGASLEPPIPFGARTGLDATRYTLGSYAISVIFIEDETPRWADAGRTIEYRHDQIRQAADWWDDQTEDLHPSARLEFNVEFINGGTPQVVGSIGVASRACSRFDFVDDAFDRLGYGHIPDRWDKVRQFNEDPRRAHGTNWSFTRVVKPGDGRPFVNGINRSMAIDFIYDFRNIYMHEWGHIFGAADEYPPARTSIRAGYLHYEYGNAFYLSDGVTKLPVFGTLAGVSQLCLGGYVNWHQGRELMPERGRGWWKDGPAPCGLPTEK